MTDKKYSENELCFEPPKGFVPPEGTAVGKPFDVVCTFEAREDGKLELTKLGDVSMEPDKEDEGEETEQEGGEGEVADESGSKPDYSQYTQGIMQAGQPQA